MLRRYLFRNFIQFSLHLFNFKFPLLYLKLHKPLLFLFCLNFLIDPIKLNIKLFLVSYFVRHHLLFSFLYELALCNLSFQKTDLFLNLLACVAQFYNFVELSPVPLLELGANSTYAFVFLFELFLTLTFIF
jgi:hypothetical protein